MKRHFLDRLMNWLSLLLLAATTLFLLLSWQGIPAEIPMHFNALGEIDRWGGKASLLGHLLSTLKCLITALFVFLTLWCTLARPLPGWFLPIVLACLFGDMLYWLVRVVRAR